MPPRIRSLAQLMDDIITPWMANEGSADLPILAFAATQAEKKLISRVWNSTQSVSLYGHYGGDHRDGVDVRDLRLFPDSSFSAAMGILLFDYFEDHDAALAELYRVLAPGSVFFTLILEGRVLTDATPPTVTRRIEPRPGYFDYVPEGEELLNVNVGRDWFVQAMVRAGFQAEHVELTDEATGKVQQWFCGYKLEETGRGSMDDRKPVSPAVIGTGDEWSEDGKASTIAAPTITGTSALDGHRRVFRRRIDPAFGFKTLRVTLEIPAVPIAAQNASFAEHRSGTGAVTAMYRGGVLLSTDQGENWVAHDVPDMANGTFEQMFTTDAGAHIARPKMGADQPDGPSELWRFDPDWRLTDRVPAGNHRWHGSASIGQSGDTIIWAEYPANSAKYRPDFQGEPDVSRVFRSRDDGASWTEIYSQPGTAIRHFHTVVSDPSAQGHWWLSSGDRAKETRVWMSQDDGDSWTDVTNSEPAGELPVASRHIAQSVQRYTDIWMGPDHLIWGTDDWHGSPANLREQASLPRSDRIGSRFFASDRTAPLQPRYLGYAGNPVRSLVDVGPALVAITEAKREVLPKPQILLVAKDGSALVEEIFTLPVAANRGTGFTYSRASRAADDGYFFSFRGTYDLVRHPTRLLRWHITFD